MKRFFVFAFVAVFAVLGACEEPVGKPSGGSEYEGGYVGTVTVAPGTPMGFELKNIRVEFVADDGGETGRIEMFKVKFAEAMPVSIDMTIPGVLLAGIEGGYAISCSSEGIVPIAMSMPMEERRITELVGSATEDELSFSMVCSSLPLSFEGKKE